MGRKKRMRSSVYPLKGARMRVFDPFPAYIQFLKRNKIKFRGKQVGRDKYGPRYDHIEFSAEDRFKAKEDFHGLSGVSGYIYKIVNGKEVILQSF